MLRKYVVFATAWLTAQLLIGYLSIIFVLPLLITVMATRPRLVMLGLVVAGEWLTAQPPGVMAVTLVIPWLLRPTGAMIDVSISYLLWVMGIVIVQWHFYILPQIWTASRGQNWLTINWLALAFQWPWLHSLIVIGGSSIVVFGATIWFHFNTKQD